MKKTYETPMLIVGGNIVRETLNGAIETGESQGQVMFLFPIAGSVGYYL